MTNTTTTSSVAAARGGHDVDQTVVRATRCHGSKRKRQCSFDSQQLQLDTATFIEFVANNGKRVKCDKKKIHNNNNNPGVNNIWYGDCDGDASDANFIRRKDRNGNTRVFGSVHIGTDICQISPNATGVDEMTCTAITDFPPEQEGVVVPPDDDDDDENEDRALLLQNLPVGYHPNAGVDHYHYNETDALRSRRSNRRRHLYDDSGTTIDVMVVWTKQAECQVSKLPSPCTLTTITENNIRGLIDLAVAETNTAFQLSGIVSSLRLVHAYRDPNYVEPTIDAYDVSLSQLRGTTDGTLDDVHAKRALYGADMVQMLIGNGDFCGIAYSSSSRTNAFAVVGTNCATGYYSYAHEIGHNFGMKHDRGTANACTAAGSNYGYRAPDASFRSILAYSCATAQCDNMPKNGCPRVQRFSNTQFLYNGKPMGNQNNDNAKQWNSLRATVASHYPAMNCNSNSQCNDNNAGTMDTCNVAKAVCVFTPMAPTKTPTRLPTKVPTRSPTKRPTRSPTKVPTRFPTKRPTRSPTKVPTRSPTKRPTRSPTKAPTRSPTKRPTRAPTKAPTRFPTKRPTRAPTKVPTRSPTKRPTRSPTKVPTRFPTKRPTRAPTKVPTRFPTKRPTRSPTKVPTRSPTKRPSRSPTKIPTRFPTKQPSRSPTKVPTRSPTKRPSRSPTKVPTRSPTKRPTGSPTKVPTRFPTKQPTRSPTKAPTFVPTKAPTVSPTKIPTSFPTKLPSRAPTKAPTRLPTKRPTSSPTRAPTSSPTKTPTKSPTKRPTFLPTKLPSRAPTKSPTRFPTKRPTSSPTRAPTSSPTKAPTKSPTTQPISAPTKLPYRAPTKIPTTSPTTKPTSAISKAPTIFPMAKSNSVPTKIPTTFPTKFPTLGILTKTPTNMPTFAPTGRQTYIVTSRPTSSPTKAPIDVPMSVPTNIPAKIPTRTPPLAPTVSDTKDPSLVPTKIPTNAPVVPIPQYYMESKVIAGVSSSDWTNITLNNNYVSPIVVCTVQYELGVTLLPAVVRMRNVRSRSFQIMIQNPSNQVLKGRKVHCVIVEEGAYNLPDGRKIESRKYLSTTTYHDQSWNGDTQTYLNRYTNPIVLGQVMTYNDNRWSVFFSRGFANRNAPPNAAGLLCGKHVGEDILITRSAETVGYIVIEKGHATFPGIEMESGRTPKRVGGYVQRKYTSPFAATFKSTPIVTIVSQVGMNGREGSWAVSTGKTSSTLIGVAVDEDQTFDTERAHPAEEVDYIALTSTGAIRLTM